VARTRFVPAYTEAWLRGLRWLGLAPRDGSADMALRFGSIGEQVRREVARHAPTFGDFVRLPRHHPSGIFERFHTNQLDYLADDAGVLRFEQLDRDFNALAAQIGFPGRLPHVNKSSRGAAHHTYYDDATRAITGERFRRDLERFAYAY
jgi:hypothetical protein